MRVEVDLENSANQLRDGMFGRVTVQLTSAKNDVSIPSTCIVSGAEGSTPSVYVVRNEHVQLIPVKIGRDTGVQAEVLSGLAQIDLSSCIRRAICFLVHLLRPFSPRQKRRRHNASGNRPRSIGISRHESDRAVSMSCLA